ncbi:MULTISPECIES: pentapeptide repeat-containing protein [Calothrix]|uniref:pentapeptide repeat-containing protein n=1 Tax=Calothrix TaxID=1186 RepID=UPI0036F4174C
MRKKQYCQVRVEDVVVKYNSRANLNLADVYEANLTRVDLSESNLSWAIFRGSNLTDANLIRADLDNTKFSD